MTKTVLPRTLSTKPLLRCFLASTLAIVMNFAVFNSSASAAATQVLANGGFESATPAMQAFSSTSAVARKQTKARSGTWSEQIQSNSATTHSAGFNYTPGLSKQPAGTLLTASCWVKANVAGKYPASLRITEIPLTGAQTFKSAKSVGFIPSTSWQSITVAYTLVSAGSQPLLSAFSNSLTSSNGGMLWVDDCSLTATPPAPPTDGFTPLTPGTSWQWQIDGGTINQTVLDAVSNPKKMYDVDMENTDAATISQLKAKGITVICYMETGSWENYRADAESFPSSVLGNNMDGYPDERYLDIRQMSVLRPIMDARLDRAQAKGCDGIEPDIDDSFQESTGFPLTEAIQVAYNAQLIADAHARGMSMGQKNGAGQPFTHDMLTVAKADWALNEQCNEYSECAGYSEYIAANKAVFQVEYQSEGMTVAKFCPADNAANFDGLLKKSSETLAALPRTACRLG